MATNLFVEPLWKGETPERMINRFCKKYRESDLYNEIKQATFYEKPSVKRHRDKRRKVFMNDIIRRIKDGKLRPKNKRLYAEIMETK